MSVDALHSTLINTHTYTHTNTVIHDCVYYTTDLAVRCSNHCGDKSGTVLIGMKTTLWQYIMFYVSFMSFIVILMRGCISGKGGGGSPSLSSLCWISSLVGSPEYSARQATQAEHNRPLLHLQSVISMQMSPGDHTSTSVLQESDYDSSGFSGMRVECWKSSSPPYAPLGSERQPLTEPSDWCRALSVITFALSAIA